MKIKLKRPLKALLLIFFMLIIFFFKACGDTNCVDSEGGGCDPCLGTWLLINFLTDDDKGVWDEDDMTGIGMTAVIRDTEWIQKDYDGCEVTYSYSVDENSSYTRQGVDIGILCDFHFMNPKLLVETGYLEFTGDNNIMIDYFDIEPGDTILAFKWMKQSEGCDFSSEPGEPERCFGGVGTRCKGDAPGAPFTKDEDTCYVYGWMSVGSILHDKCCIETNNTGYSCLALNQGDPNLCKKEWEEAWFNTLCSLLFAPRQWQYTFGPYPAGNAGDDTNQDLRAPVGTRINPEYQNLCSSGSCMVDAEGNTIIEWDLCGQYCECQ